MGMGLRTVIGIGAFATDVVAVGVRSLAAERVRALRVAQVPVAAGVRVAVDVVTVPVCEDLIDRSMMTVAGRRGQAAVPGACMS